MLQQHIEDTYNRNIDSIIDSPVGGMPGENEHPFHNQTEDTRNEK